MKKNSLEYTTEKYKISLGYLEGIISVIVNTLLFGFNYWVG